jgi:hypothetical protein
VSQPTSAFAADNALISHRARGGDRLVNSGLYQRLLRVLLRGDPRLHGLLYGLREVALFPAELLDRLESELLLKLIGEFHVYSAHPLLSASFFSFSVSLNVFAEDDASPICIYTYVYRRL